MAAGHTARQEAAAADGTVVTLHRPTAAGAGHTDTATAGVLLYADFAELADGAASLAGCCSFADSPSTEVAEVD